MNADREPNRLPLRAGAMLLLAVAVVFIGLGWHSAATSSDDPEAALEAANKTQTTTSAAPTSTTAAAAAKPVCVYNAGGINGLGREVTDELKAKGFQTRAPQTYTDGTFSENTIFYDDAASKAQADQIAAALGGSYVVEERAPAFAGRCEDGIPVIAFERSE